jgi:ABC-type sugar transport system ATPase subunit
MAAITLERICKHYDTAKIVDDVTLEIGSGELVVLVGPSGCGKSTILRMIAGLLAPTSGRILIDGKDVTHTPAGERDIAMVFQSYALYPHMTVADNIAFPLKVRRVAKAEIERRVAAVAETLGLSAMLGRLPKDLSGGQRQRVAMGRAIVREPKAFLFDEPLSNLDAALRSRMRGEIAALHRRLGSTMIYVTHDQHEAMTLADRLVLLHGGEIVQQGKPLSVYREPNCRFVGEFIGNPPMNFLPAVASEGHVQAGELRLPVPMADVPRELWLGVRPEHWRLAKPNNGEQALLAQVEWVERTGSEGFLYARACEQQLIVRLEPSEAAALQPGEAVALAATDIRLFARDSGRAIGAQA